MVISSKNVKITQKAKDRLRICVIGGGTGLPILLSGLKAANCDITAVVTVADDGGSSGAIRTSVNTIPPGDIRNCIVALSNIPQIYKDIFQYRFAPQDNEFSGHAIGNLIIAALTEMRGDVYSSLRLLSTMMQLQGQVLPAAEEPLILQGYFEDGTMVEGESTIVKQGRPIQHVEVRAVNDPKGERQLEAGRGVISAIMTADLVVLGPGSLYTSILPNVVIDEIREAICETPAKVVYICNIMTQLGETENFSDADHVRTINEHLGQKRIDIALINETIVPSEYIESDETPDYLVQVTHDAKGLLAEKCDILSADFLTLKKHGVYHDQEKLVKSIFEIHQKFPLGSKA